jgi:ssDNA-binding Zn-finger/Zn-ribbon topoisomerase 1
MFQIAVEKTGGTMPLTRFGSPSDTVPNCPVCGKMMVLRINRDSTYTGKKYYGCMDSPKCNGIIPLD